MPSGAMEGSRGATDVAKLGICDKERLWVYWETALGRSLGDHSPGREPPPGQCPGGLNSYGEAI